MGLVVVIGIWQSLLTLRAALRVKIMFFLDTLMYLVITLHHNLIIISFKRRIF